MRESHNQLRIHQFLVISMVVLIALATSGFAIPLEPICGNGFIDEGEICELGDSQECSTGDGYSGTQTCSATCADYDPCEPEEYCGDGMINGPEMCDGDSVECTTDNGYYGTQACSDMCSEYNSCETEEYCGDGMINGPEMCDDGDDFNGMEGYCNEECTEQTIGEPVTIHSVELGPDRFACSLPEEDSTSNSDVTISVDATDNVAVAWVRADIGEVVPPSETQSTTAEGSSNIVDLEYNEETDRWEYTLTTSDTSQYNFETKTITITADDDAGNGYQVAEGGSDTASVVLYSMTTPPTLSECQRAGSDTTNLCEQQDFSNINFIYEIEQFGSPDCNNGMEMPWGWDYEYIVRWDFESVNFDDENIAEKLLAVGSALDVFITPPGEFGDSYINVDTSAFTALDTATTITLYGLPFSDWPTIVEPEGRGDTITDIDFWTDEPWEIDIYDEDTGDYLFTQYVPYGTLTFTVEGFSPRQTDGGISVAEATSSQYDITDEEVPIVEISSPANGGSTTSSTIEAEVYVDGTGSQLSGIKFILDDEEVLSYDYWDIMELCGSEDDSFTQVYCYPELQDITEGGHTFKVVATDLGGAEGNSVELEITFTKDTTAPEITYFYITPEEGTTDETITVTTKVADALSSLGSISLYNEEADTYYEGSLVDGEENVKGVSGKGSTSAIYSFSVPLGELALGTYTLALTIGDTLENTQTERKTFNVTETSSSDDTFLDEWVEFDEESTETVRATDLNITLEIDVLAYAATSFYMKGTSTAPGADDAGLHLDHFVQILAPDLEGNIDSARITFNYSDAEVAAKGIDESTLRLYYYNETSGEWVKYDGEDGVAPDGGVDTEANQVWAITDHFSTWGMFGAAPAASTSSTSSVSGGGGSGGGTCSSGYTKVGGRCVKDAVPVQQVSEEPSLLPVLDSVPVAQETTTDTTLDVTSAPTAETVAASPLGVGQATGIFSRFTSKSLFGGIAAIGVLALIGGLGFSYWKKKGK